MADFGSLTTRSIPVGIGRASLDSFGGSASSEFNLGSFSIRTVGGSGTTTIIEVPTIIPAPPSTNGSGDWPMRFYGKKLTADSAGLPNQLYMCPNNSVLYVRFYQIINRGNSPTTVKLWFMTADGWFEQETVASLAAGASIVQPAGFMFDLGEGEYIAGSASGANVFCNVTGVESVQA